MQETLERHCTRFANVLKLTTSELILLNLLEEEHITQGLNIGMSVINHLIETIPLFLTAIDALFIIGPESDHWECLSMTP